MKRSERYTIEDKEGLIAWAALSTVLHDKEIAGIEHRFAQIPGGKRDLSLMRSLATKYMPLLVQVMPFQTTKEINQTEAILKHMKIYTGIKNLRGHDMLDGAKDFGWFLTLEEVDVILEALGDRCLLCNKTPEQERQCPLKQVLDKLPLASNSGRWCARSDWLK